MEELDLKDLFELLLSKIYYIIAIMMIFIGIGSIYTFAFTKPMYSSYTTLVLTVSDTNTGSLQSNSITTNDITLNSKLVSTYSALIESKNVLRQVISNLEIDMNENSLKKNIHVTSVSDTELIKITVTNENPENSAKIANEIANVFSKEVTKLYNINNIHVVDEAEISNSPSNINHIKDIVIFAFIGIVVAIGYVLLINMIDTTIKSTDDIEKGLGLPVIATLPLMNNSKKNKGGKK